MSRYSTSDMTVQADVAPGDVTGIYYITICNLPFGSSWQELKDWLRQACVVDHIELFRTSTSGWIRLRGRDEFEKAWRHINSVDFRGRYIIASDRNRTEPIKIKELVDTRTCYSPPPPVQYEKLYRYHPACYVPTQPLKILITSIPQRASPEETLAWIRRRAGPYAGDILHIDVPSSASAGGRMRVRGHAFVIFSSTAAARAAVQLLHQASFQNRTISARFTMEGVTADEQMLSASGPSSTGLHCREAREEEERCCEVPVDLNCVREGKVRHVIADGSSRRFLDKTRS